MPANRSKKPLHNRASRKPPELSLHPFALDLRHFAGDPDFVLSLARGLQVIESFEGHTDGLFASEIAQKTGLSRAAVRRLLMTLEHLGYAELRGRTYRLKTRILKLGFALLSSNPLIVHAQPLLESVTEELHESSSICVLDGDEVLYVARSAAKRVMSVQLSVGSRLPAYCTSVGRVLLASLQEQDFLAYLQRVPLAALTPKTVTHKSALLDIIRRVRLDGYSLVDEEVEIGLRSIAVPVRSRRGRVLAAINIGTHAGRVAIPQVLKRFLPLLLEKSQSLGQFLD